MSKKKKKKIEGEVNQTDQERPTVGEIYLENIEKPLETTIIEEQSREQLNEYKNNLFEAVDRGKSEFPNDFFIVVLTKREQLMDMIMRHYFITRLSCPTPNYDQEVFKFHRKSEELEFLWSIPDRRVCLAFLNNPYNIPQEDLQLMEYIMAFKDGSLMKLCKKLNKEVNV